MKLLLVEDDTMVGAGLQKSLTKSGYVVDWTQDGEQAEVAGLDRSYDLIILDLGLPGKDGMQVLKSLREKKRETPILILSARDGIDDKVRGLDGGADDYLLKPFSLDELEARIRLLTRRRNNSKSNAVTVGDLILNEQNHTTTFQGQHYDLSHKEFALLYILAQNPDAVFSRPQLEEKLYGWNEDLASNAVEVHIHQIRKKLGKGIIKNNRGVGYSLGIKK